MKPDIQQALRLHIEATAECRRLLAMGNKQAKARAKVIALKVLKLEAQFAHRNPHA